MDDEEAQRLTARFPKLDALITRYLSGRVKQDDPLRSESGKQRSKPSRITKYSRKYYDD